VATVELEKEKPKMDFKNSGKLEYLSNFDEKLHQKAVSHSFLMHTFSSKLTKILIF